MFPYSISEVLTNCIFLIFKVAQLGQAFSSIKESLITFFVSFIESRYQWDWNSKLKTQETGTDPASGQEPGHSLSVCQCWTELKQIQFFNNFQ